MKFFLDSASVEEIVQVLSRGFASGITTNPTHLRRHVQSDPLAYLQRIVAIIASSGTSLPLSVQVMTSEVSEMMGQAETIADRLGYRELVIKIPFGWDELEVIHALALRGVRVNCTACMTYAQAMLAASAGARYVSLFYGKMGDAGLDAGAIVNQVVQSLDLRTDPCELIVGSIRKPFDITEILSQGAHIVTVPFDFVQRLCQHAKTDEAVLAFANNFLPLGGDHE